MFAKLFRKTEPKETEPKEKVFSRPLVPRPLTRFPAKPPPFDVLKDASETAPPPLTVQVSALAEQAAPVIDPIHHLYSNAPIPVDVLRRALPQRFREIDAKASVLSKILPE